MFYITCTEDVNEKNFITIERSWNINYSSLVLESFYVFDWINTCRRYNSRAVRMAILRITDLCAGTNFPDSPAIDAIMNPIIDWMFYKGIKYVYICFTYSELVV
jgi:hypothetical protein